MKRYLSVVILIAFAGSAALAQGPKVGALTAGSAGDAAASHSTASEWGLPAVPGKILFYGGDINVNDPNAGGWANENTLLVSSAAVYAAVTAPENGKVVTSAVFFNNAATGGFFDPPVGYYDIRTGVSEGNGGTDLLHGSAAQTATPTGRDPFGLIEYTCTVSFAKALTAKPGTTYWFNEQPQCTNTGDANCSSQEYFFDNTTQQTNGVNANAQPPYQMYAYSAYFGFNWENLCGSGQLPGCKWGSWGLLK